MSYAANASKLETARERVVELTEQLANAVQTGRNGHDSAAKVAMLAMQRALAERDFNEALSLVHCDSLNLKPDAEEWDGFRTIRPNYLRDNADEFADWAKELAHGLSYARTIDLRPMLAAAE